MVENGIENGNELDDTIERKVQERLDRRLEEEVEKKIKERESERVNRNKDSSTNLSRRDFLKKIGTGVAGLGALTILPSASAFNIRTSNSLKYFGDNQDNPNFSVQPDGTLETQSINSNELGITNESFVRFTRSSNSSSSSSGTWISAFDGASKDNRSETNSSQEFTPDKSGEYDLFASVDFDGSSSENDNVQLRLFNVTDGSPETPLLYGKLGGLIAKAVNFSYTFNLEAGDTYRIEARNADSSFEIDDAQTEAVLKRSAIQ